jgi:2-hydroxychromene-2-carboxylate isomerase
MTKVIEFHFDYLSPYTYLADTQFAGLGAEVHYHPVPILAVMKIVNNQPSPRCPPKARYAGLDAARWAARYGVKLGRNDALWAGLSAGALDSAIFIRGALAAQELGGFAAYHTAIFNAIWRDARDVVSHEGRTAVLFEAGVAAEEIWDRAEETDILATLERQVQISVDKGVFGTPTFFVDGEMFFGNDRLEFVRERIHS